MRITFRALVPSAALMLGASLLTAQDLSPLELPPGVKFSLLLDTNEHFLGENILLHYCISNASSTAFQLSVGGDYRGGSRAKRFKITATDPARHCPRMVGQPTGCAGKLLLYVATCPTAIAH